MMMMFLLGKCTPMWTNYETLLSLVSFTGLLVFSLLVFCFQREALLLLITSLLGGDVLIIKIWWCLLTPVMKERLDLACCQSRHPVTLSLSLSYHPPPNLTLLQPWQPSLPNVTQRPLETLFDLLKTIQGSFASFGCKLSMGSATTLWISILYSSFWTIKCCSAPRE